MKNKLKRIVSMLLCAMLLCGLLPLAAAAGDTGTVEQKPYVSANLIRWFDAGNNGNGSHRDDGMWKDLSGNANHISCYYSTDQHGHRWEENAFFMDPASGGRLNVLNWVMREDFLTSYAYTVELVLGDIVWEDSASPILFSSKNGAIKLTAFRNRNGTVDLTFKNGEPDGEYFAAQATVEDLSGITLAVTVDEDRDAPNSCLYVNGTKVGEGNAPNFTEEDIEKVTLGCTEAEGRWGGQLHGIRVYNRALTAEELAANAAADSFNYREGNVIEPVQRYDPHLDMCVTPVSPVLDAVKQNHTIPINDETDAIPMYGFYGIWNLLDYLYPYESDEIPWEGARLTLCEKSNDPDDISYIPVPMFSVVYQQVCSRARLMPLTLSQTQYIVLSCRAVGEIGGIRMVAVGCSADEQELFEMPCSAVTTPSILGDGTGDVQYLAFKLDELHEQLQNEADYLSSVKVYLDDIDEEDILYVTEMSLFATEAEMCAYTGLPYDEPSTEPDTDPETEPDVKPETEPDTEPVTDVVPDENHGGSEPETESDRDSETTAPDEGTSDVLTTASEPDESHGEGCSSAIGLGAVAVLTAMAAVAALKRRGD